LEGVESKNKGRRKIISGRQDQKKKKLDEGLGERNSKKRGNGSKELEMKGKERLRLGTTE